MAVNKYGDISPRTATAAAKKLLRVAQPLMYLQRFGQEESQAKNTGRTRTWRRYESFPPVSAPLVEGVTPPGQVIRYTDVSVVLMQYGDLVRLTDVIQDTHEDPVLQTMMDRCGEQAAETTETVGWNALCGGTNVQYAASVASRALVNNKVSRGDIMKIERTLDRAGASPITKIITPTPDYGSKGIEPAYWALCHTDLRYDIRTASGFVSVVEYGSQATKVEGEVGAIDRVRFITSRLYKSIEAAGVSGTTYLSSGETPPVGGAAADVYPIIVIGRDAYASVKLQGMDAVEIGVLNPGVVRGGDECGQRGSVSWKLWFAVVILNQAWLCRYEVGCTANPT
jgi:N4-gp56 family major capsid protein